MGEQAERIGGKLKFLVRVLAFVFVAMLATFAAIENTDRVRLSLLGYESAELSIFWWLLIVLVIGVILGRLIKIR